SGEATDTAGKRLELLPLVRPGLPLQSRPRHGAANQPRATKDDRAGPQSILDGYVAALPESRTLPDPGGNPPPHDQTRLPTPDAETQSLVSPAAARAPRADMRRAE